MPGPATRSGPTRGTTAHPHAVLDTHATTRMTLLGSARAAPGPCLAPAQ